MEIGMRDESDHLPIGLVIEGGNGGRQREEVQRERMEYAWMEYGWREEKNEEYHNSLRKK